MTSSWDELERRARDLEAALSSAQETARRAQASEVEARRRAQAAEDSARRAWRIAARGSWPGRGGE